MVSKNKSNINPTALIIVVLVFTSLYAVLRYNIFSDILWSDFPLFILNKILSFSAVILLSLAIIFRKKEDSYACKKVLKYSKVLILTHFILSFIIFTSFYYPKFFIEGKINLVGQFSILAGIAALFQMNNLRYYKLSRLEKSISFFRRNGFEFLLIFLSLHLIVMGYSGWLKIDDWPGVLPPISLLSFIVILIPFIIKRKSF